MRQSTLLGLPTSLLLLVTSQAQSQQARQPIAIRKLPLAASEKLLPEHFAFADSPAIDTDKAPPFLSPREAVLADRLQLSVNEEQLIALNASDPSSRPYRPAFKLHEEEGRRDGWDLLRRAAEVLKVLEGRQTCPGGMEDCSNVGAPNKCCMNGEVCVEVDNAAVGNVACCPEGAECGGPIGACPDGSPTCSTELGGGCCIPGFVCQGVGCVPSPPPVITSTTQRPTTITSTSTTVVEGDEPTTIVVTVVITATPEAETVTRTSTSILTPTPSTTTVNTVVIPPYRPTSAESQTTESTTSSETAPAETPEDYCPTGFYACLAREGGGCCRTGRDCATVDCPTTPLTTITTDGATIVVPVTDARDAADAQATETCASGWFLCGDEGGPVAGCCPSGFECGTASCTSASASQTGEVQKVFPEAEGGAGDHGLRLMSVVAMVSMVALAVLA
ncbi:hypothetical protein D7B24_001271 [Verticillium nonalfalfae]|uniref:GPI anchored protein n=1 Tax=Verticillium nonalfalfae TaxID=1051616 RepID=A0A3M9Y040_9PEZI|nr:uncharacterized protein D7B24_001271 [Verticillium nonalfalfae]RNJ53863.1 hypothetical protein D7B24_001271 [Verticillium nonalfalfae]